MGLGRLYSVLQNSETLEDPERHFSNFEARKSVLTWLPHTFINSITLKNPEGHISNFEALKSVSNWLPHSLNSNNGKYNDVDNYVITTSICRRRFQQRGLSGG